MKLTAAIPLKKNNAKGLQVLLTNLQAHGFGEVIFLLLDGISDALTPEIRNPSGIDQPQVVKIHPDFVGEAALSQATGDWVFIFYPGETLEWTRMHYEGEDESLLGAIASCEGRTQITLNGELRGFRRNTLSGCGTIDLIDFKVFTVERLDEPQAKPAWSPSIPLTVILPTWRLGGLDVTLGALAKQTFQDFEVILVDALHRWRVMSIAPRLDKLPFRVHHVPVDNSIFPVSSHSRFRNTAIRRASGERLVFLSDYACPDENFLAAHVGLPANHLGVSTYLRTVIDPASIDCEGTGDHVDANGFHSLLTVWDVMERARRGEYLWSTFKFGVDPFAMAIEHERVNKLVPPKFPIYWGAHIKLSTPEFLSHWKADSVATEAVKQINGWDESFDGNGSFADVDFSLRLLWSGVEPVPVASTVRILDAHIISVAPIRDTTKNNFRKLAETRERRALRCTHGLVAGVIHE